MTAGGEPTTEAGRRMYEITLASPDRFGAGWLAMILAIEAEARAEDLDLDRLVEAFEVVQPTLYGRDYPRDDPDDFQFLNPREHANAIAAAYRRGGPP